MISFVGDSLIRLKAIHLEVTAMAVEVSPRVETVVVDDLRTFKEDLMMPSNESLTVYKRDSVTAAAYLIECHEAGVVIDQLWLDHDLGQDTCGNDTTDVLVHLLSEWAFWGQPLKVGVINIHTCNPPARDSMLCTLRRYGYNARIVDPVSSGLYSAPVE